MQRDFVLSRFEQQQVVFLFEGNDFDRRQVVEVAAPQVVLLVHVDENLPSVGPLFRHPVGKSRGPALHVRGVGLAVAHLQLHSSSEIKSVGRKHVSVSYWQQQETYSLKRRHAGVFGGVVDDGFVGRIEILAFDHQLGASRRRVEKAFHALRL